MEYCPRCMRPVQTPICPHCGTGVKIQNLPPLLPVGTKLTGGAGKTYQLGMALGAGGFGITYIGLELETGRRVAVKEYFPKRCNWVVRGKDGVTVEAVPGQENVYNRGRISFLKEAQVLASIDACHPAVVEGLDYVETNNTAYLVMEYLDGKPLFQVVRERGVLTPGELLPKIDTLMDGIIWLHNRGIIHRDLCPDNIMWMPDDTLKLIDFGAARMAEGNSQLTVSFKPGYAPLEQYTSSGQGPWTDVYTLAATIWYCLNGRDPIASAERMYAIHGTDASGNAVANGTDPLLPPASLDPTQQAALMHALGLKKEDRTQTMEQFRQELFPPARPVFSKKSRTGGTAGQPARPVQGGAGWLQSHKKLVIGAAAAVVVLVILALLLGGSRPSKPAPSTSTPAPAVSAPVAPASEALVPEKIPNRQGTTEDGYDYEIVEGEYAVLTGCSSTATVGTLPDTIEGVPVTQIADKAFAGAKTDSCVTLPDTLESIGAGAFRGCVSLEEIAAHSDVSVDETSFEGCGNLKWVHTTTAGISGWKVPEGVSTFCTATETGVGTLDSFERSGSELYGVTPEGERVLLSSRSEADALELRDDTSYICEGALDHIQEGAAVKLGQDTYFAYSMFDRFQWSAPEGGFSDAWLFTCKTANAVNAARPAETPRIAPDHDMVRAAGILGEMLKKAGGGEEPDMQALSAALEEVGITEWDGLLSAGFDQGDTRDELESSIIKFLADQLEEPESDEEYPEFVGSYYTKLGVACVKNDDGKYYAGACYVAPPADDAA